MSVLVLGSTGMLGRALMREARSRRLAVRGAARAGADITLDITDDKALGEVLAQTRPTLVLNAAAMINHGECERQPEKAYAVNAHAVEVMAEALGETKARLVHVSTDHYFTGDGAALHDEEAPVTLVSQYARTKYAGEEFALSNPKALVVRTNITGFRGEPGLESFIEWACRSIDAGEEMTLFPDYYTSTIATRQFAVALFDLLNLPVTGRINLAAREASSKQDFLVSLASHMGRPLRNPKTRSVHDVLPGRADSCGLDVSRAERLLGRSLPGLNDVTQALAEEYRALTKV